MLFERLFPISFQNKGNESLLIRVDDDDFIVPAGACLSSQGDTIYLTNPGDAPTRAFPVRRIEPRWHSLPRRSLPAAHRARGTLVSEIFHRATAQVI